MALADETPLALAFAAGRLVTLRRADRTPGLLASVADELHRRGLWQPLLDQMGDDMRTAVQVVMTQDWQAGRDPKRNRYKTVERAIEYGARQ